MKFARRRDANEHELVSAARRIGLKVFYCNELGDALVQFADRTELWEFKTENGKLTAMQCRLRQAGLNAYTIRNVEDVLEGRKRFLKS